MIIRDLAIPLVIVAILSAWVAREWYVTLVSQQARAAARGAGLEACEPGSQEPDLTEAVDLPQDRGAA